MVTQITVKVYTQIAQVTSRFLARAKTWQSPLLTEKHDDSPWNKAVPPPLPTALTCCLCPEAAEYLQLEIIYLGLKSADTVTCISQKRLPKFF